jgi:hypothetical protein
MLARIATFVGMGPICPALLRVQVPEAASERPMARGLTAAAWPELSFLHNATKKGDGLTE